MDIQTRIVGGIVTTIGLASGAQILPTKNIPFGHLIVGASTILVATMISKDEASGDMSSSANKVRFTIEHTLNFLIGLGIGCDTRRHVDMPAVAKRPVAIIVATTSAMFGGIIIDILTGLVSGLLSRMIFPRSPYEPPSTTYQRPSRHEKK